MAGSVVGFLTGASGLLMAEASLWGVLALGFGEVLVGSIVTQKLLNEDGEIDWGVAIEGGMLSLAMAGFMRSVGRSVKGVGGESEVLERGTASNYGIDMDNLNFSNTVQNHTGRPYQDSKLLINEIIESKPPAPDPRGTNALSWTVEGVFNGSTGYYELIIDPTSNTVWHFVFKSQ